MGWFKVEHDTPSKPEVLEISRRLNEKVPTTLGRLILVWAWFSRQSCDGRVRGLSADSLDQIADMPGFTDAMLEVGWLVQDDDGLGIPKFEQWLGSAKEAKRRAERRKKADSVSADCPRTSSGQSADKARTIRSKTQTQTETLKRYPLPPTDGPLKVGPKPPTRPEDVVLPGCLLDPNFQAHYLLWCKHRRDGWPREKWTTIAAQRKLAALEKLGLVEATRWITFAIDNGLKNIQEPFSRSSFLDRNGHHDDQAAERSRQSTLKELGL